MEKAILSANYDPIQRRVNPDNIDGMSQIDIEAVPLADGVMGDAAVLSDNPAVKVNNLAGGIAGAVRDISGFSIEEAKVLAFRLGADRESLVGSDFPDLGLGKAAKREENTLKL
jgi:hypothetical protein